MKNLCTRMYYKNYYTLAQMRNVTNENGGTKMYSYVEFREIIGISVQYYDDNVELFKDMKYLDIKAWLEDNPNWDEE